MAQRPEDKNTGGIGAGEVRNLCPASGGENENVVADLEVGSVFPDPSDNPFFPVDMLCLVAEQKVDPPFINEGPRGYNHSGGGDPEYEGVK